jgi:hypothetical protein
VLSPFGRLRRMPVHPVADATPLGVNRKKIHIRKLTNIGRVNSIDNLREEFDMPLSL